MNLKGQLKLYLKKARISPAELARRSGVARQVIADWLVGKSPRNLSHLKAVANALETDVDTLVFGEGIPDQKKETIDVEQIIGDRWISGLFEVRLRRVKQKKEDQG